MPSATVNHNRDEPRLVPTISFRAEAQVGCENIGCGAVEAALLEHPDIVEVSVYGLPDERLGEELGATIYGEIGVSETELRAFLAPRLARFEIPRYLYFSAEPLPRGASGKILKRELRDQAVNRLAPPAPSNRPSGDGHAS